MTAKILFTGDPYENYYYPDSGTSPYQFTYSDTQNIDTASFSGNTLTVEDRVVGSGALGWSQTFTDETNPITSASLVSSTFSPAIDWFLSGGVLTVNWAGEQGVGGTFDAIFNLDAAAVPEPATIGMFGIGLVAIGFATRRRGVG